MGPISEATKLERLIDRVVTPLPAPLAPVVAVPMGVAGLMAIVGAMLIPRRLPDLRRLTASDEFVAAQAGAADWTRALFALIEERASWLHLTGRRVNDSCQLEVIPTLDIELPIIGVQSDHWVVRVYGADGPIRHRLTDLGAILAAAGCEEFFLGVTSGYGPLESALSPTNGRWRDPRRAGSEDEDAVPPAGLTQYRSVHVGWTSRGEPPNSKHTLDGRYRAGGPAEPDPPAKANHFERAFERAVETAYADIDELAARALADHEHAIAITLQLCYYANPDIRRHPLPRRLVPLPVLLPFWR